MAHSTYSFDDITATIAHPDFSSYSLKNEGTGSIRKTMANDRTVHDVAADGSVMISKIKVKNGSLTIQAQQTSNLHSYLTKLYKYCESAAASTWAKITVVIQDKMTGRTVNASYGSFKKLGDEGWQAQGEQVSWELMFAEIN